MREYVKMRTLRSNKDKASHLIRKCLDAFSSVKSGFCFLLVF